MPGGGVLRCRRTPTVRAVAPFAPWHRGTLAPSHLGTLGTLAPVAPVAPWHPWHPWHPYPLPPRYNDRSPVMNPHAPGRPPTLALLLGLLITLATVVAYSWYISGQISGLRRLQTELTDRNRRDSLQLLRIQNDLNQLALAMRDMLDASERYPLTAWSAQFARIRAGSRRRAGRRKRTSPSPDGRPSRPQYLTSSVAQFWDAADRIFRPGAWRAAKTRRALQIRCRCRRVRRRSASTVARLLVQNNASEEQTAQQVQDIYDRGPAAGVLVPRRHARRHCADQPLSDSIEPAALRPARRRSPTSGASWPRSSSPRASRRCARSRASCTTSSARC